MNIDSHVYILLENYHNHFRETLSKFHVKKLGHLDKENKKKFFSHLKMTWRSKKNSPLR